MKSFLGGIVTETNTMSPIPTGLHDYEVVADLRDAAPGGDLLAFAEEAKKRGDTLVFGFSAFAMPAGITTKVAYETLKSRFLDKLRAAMPLDAVLLPLHGAMVADGVDDAEGDLIQAVREIVGPHAVIGVHIDLHCHLTERMLKHANALVIYKEYPHTDMADRARDLYRLVSDTFHGRIQPVMAMHPCFTMGIYPTNPEPMRSFVNDMMAAEGKDGVLSLSLGHGFPWGDVPDSGARMLAVVDAKVVGADSATVAQQTARGWARRFYDLRHQVGVRPLAMEAALARAVELRPTRNGPIVLADQADNAGGGAPSDSTFVLQHVLERGMEGVSIAMLWDPVVVRLAEAAGVGARITLRLGGKVGPMSGQPLDVNATVMGVQRALVQMWPQTEGAVESPAGDVAHLRVHGLVGQSDGPGVDVMVNSRRGQVLGLEPFTAFGIDMVAGRILVVKSIQHFYAAFGPVAGEVIYMAAPGAVAPIMQTIPLKRADLNQFPWVEDPWRETP
jgi:microcystin degradation protein MlrC